MNDGLFPGDPAAQPVPDEKALKAAYIEELAAHPPTPTFEGAEARAIAARKSAAYRDIHRLHAAAKRLGCRIVLVPVASTERRE